MRKPAFCICENKDADQLRSHCTADQRLCFRLTDSTIPLLQGGQRTSQSRDFSDIVHIHLVTKTSTSGKKIDSYAEHKLHS